MESRGKLCLILKSRQYILGLFCVENNKNIPKMKDDFQENGQI